MNNIMIIPFQLFVGYGGSKINKRLLICLLFVLNGAIASAVNPCVVTSDADDGPGSLRLCLADVDNGGTINVANSMRGKIVHLSQIAIVGEGKNALHINNKTITINGNGIILTTDGAADTRILWTGFNSGSVINEVVFMGAAGAGYGGAVKADNGQTFKNCVFINNSCRDENDNKKGGAINLCGGTSLIENCIFINNSSCYGMAVTMRLNGSATLKNNIFIANKSTCGQTADYIAAGGASIVDGGGNNTTGGNNTIGSAWAIGNPTAYNVAAYILKYVVDELNIVGAGAIMVFPGGGGNQPWLTSAGQPNSSIKKVVIGEGITTTGEELGWGLVEATQVDLPSTLTDVGQSTFYNMQKLAVINLPRDVPPTINNMLYNNVTTAENTWRANVLLNIPTNKGCNYAATGWRLFEHGTADKGSKYFGKAVPTSTTGYPTGTAVSNAFRFYLDCNGKMTVTGSGSMNSGTYSFAGGSYRPWQNITSAIRAVEFGSGITASAVDMFTRCGNITSVIIPDGFSVLAQSTFYDCKNITQITSNSVSAPTATNSNGNPFRNVTKSGVQLIIPDAGVCNYGTADEWKVMIIPQLMFKFEDNK